MELGKDKQGLVGRVGVINKTTNKAPGKLT